MCARIRSYLTSQTVTFYKRIDQSEISAPKKVFVSTPKLYKHDPVFGCVCLSDKHEFSYGSYVITVSQYRIIVREYIIKYYYLTKYWLAVITYDP